MPGPPEKRVFLGGNYDNMVVLREIRRIIDDLGFSTVFGDDYIVPPNQTYIADLDLLSQCPYAVFEVTMPNGHLIEIQSAIGSGKKVILVYQARDKSKVRPSSLSAMLYTSPVRIEGYISFDELKTILPSFLT